MTDGETIESEGSGTNWVTQDFISSPTLTAIDYVIVAWNKEFGYGTASLWRDNGDTNQGHFDSHTYNGFPDPATFSHNNNKYSVYVNYTVSDTCTYTSGDWIVDYADNCEITTFVDVGSNCVRITGDAGSFTIKSGGRVTGACRAFSPDDFDGDTVIRVETGGIWDVG